MSNTICYHEHQLLGPGLEDEESYLAAKECKKNPGHDTSVFIPVCELTKEHLPSPFQKDEDLFELIKATADLTVRLRIRHTSDKRPQIDRQCYDAKGGQRNGTGFIYDVESSLHPCHCPKCKSKPEEARLSWKLKLSTAQHVVYDDEEARATTVDLFYNSEDSRIGEMRSIRGGEVKFTSDNESDRCRLVFTICDAELGSKLRELHNQRLRLRDKLEQSYASVNLVWISSHPHGIAKRITFGEIKESQALGRGFFKYSYSAQTCPGSSGAAVCEIRSVECFSWSQMRHEIYHGKRRMSHGTRKITGRMLNRGDTNSFGSGSEVKAAGSCEAHPEHSSSTPLNGLTKLHLPKRYQDEEDLLEFVKVTADMTVRLRVCDTSSTLPDDTRPISPGDGNNGGNDKVTRFGTGMIWEVYRKEADPNSSSAAEVDERTPGWECTVMTSNRLQFDGADIYIDLFHDSGDSPTVGKMVTMKGELDKKYVGPDNSRLFFSTDDVELVTRLEELKSRREMFAKRLRERYTSDTLCNLVWMVSHPHGRAKRVAFGEMRQETLQGGSGFRYRNTIDVCRGCEGAAVWWLHNTTLSPQAPTYLPHHSKAGVKFTNIGYY